MMSSYSYVDEHSRSDRTKKVVAYCAMAAALSLGLLLIYRINTLDQDQVRSAADAAAHELERTPVRGLGISIFDVERALAVGARDERGHRLASRLKVEPAGEDSRGDLYEITNSNGDHPVCLIVRADVQLASDTPTFPITSLIDGRC